MTSRYWDYWNQTGSTFGSTATTGDTGGYYWTTVSSTSASSTWIDTAYTSTYVVRREYLISGFDDWSEQDRATLTRLINDETNTGFRIKMWIKGDVDVTDMGIEIKDAEWFMLYLRQVASTEDYEKIAAHFNAVASRMGAGEAA